MARWLGCALAWLVGRLFGIRRRHAVDSLRRAGVHDAERVASAMYRSLGQGVFELLALLLPWRRPPGVAGLDTAIARVRARSRGAVVATAHTGNWDLLACVAANQVPLTVITKRLSVGFVDNLWQGIRSRRGVHLVQAGEAARVACASLERGEWVAAMIDQAPERSRGIISVSFLGQVADVDLAPALLAQRARCPLVVAFACRTGQGGHGLELAGIFHPPRRVERAWAEQVMVEATRLLEQFVLEHPEQWLWMHRRWKRATTSRALAGPSRPGELQERAPA